MNIPNPIIEQYNNISVVRDDLLLGGTKEAALLSVLPNLNGGEFIYAGPRQGYAQVALASACKILDKKCTLFIAKSKNKHLLTLQAESLGANIVEIEYGRLNVVAARAKLYSAKNGATLLPFGLSCPEIEIAITNRAKLLNISPSVVYTVAGSGTLTRSLQRAWPTASFFAIQIGKIPNAGKAKILLAPEKYHDPAKYLPPFPSCLNYDAKGWQFIKDIKEDILFWNVAK